MKLNIKLFTAAPAVWSSRNLAIVFGMCSFSSSISLLFCSRSSSFSLFWDAARRADWEGTRWVDGKLDSRYVCHRKFGGQLRIVKTRNCTSRGRSREKGVCHSVSARSGSEGRLRTLFLYAVMPCPRRQLTKDKIHAWIVVFNIGDGILEILDVEREFVLSFQIDKTLWQLFLMRCSEIWRTFEVTFVQRWPTGVQ